MVSPPRALVGFWVALLLSPAIAQPDRGRGGTIKVAPGYPLASSRIPSPSRIERERRVEEQSFATARARGEEAASLFEGLPSLLWTRYVQLLVEEFEQEASSTPARASFMSGGGRHHRRYRDDGSSLSDYAETYDYCDGPATPGQGVPPVDFTYQYSNNGYGPPALFPAR